MVSAAISLYCNITDKILLQGLKSIFIYLFFILFYTVAKAQVIQIEGTVYDFNNRLPIEAVSVLCTCGSGTLTDSNGHYSILVTDHDSLFFSYLGKNTMKYPVDTIKYPEAFEIGLHVDAKWLPEVKVQTHNYYMDSVENRRAYAKIFDYKKPGLALNQSTPSTYVPGAVTVGLDLDALINVFRFRRNRQLASFQNRLLKEEADKYIDHRYSIRLVKQLTHLESPELETFMNQYRPEYSILQQMNDLELGYYIELSYDDYLRKKQGSGRRILGTN